MKMKILADFQIYISVPLKTKKLAGFLKSGSNLFHVMIADGKNKFSKKLWFALRRGMFSVFLAEYNVRLTEIKLKRY